jgi:hypothetical protein
VKETVLSFGERGQLAGVLCEPEPQALKPGAPPVLFWNVGIQHHVGPYRIWVDLARQLASLGFRSFRFDLGNMGDSELSRGTPGSDVKDAMTALEKKLGARAFTLVGFCSSVDQLHEVGLEDPRVTGMVYVEGYAYRTRRYWQRYPLRYLSTVRWQNKLHYRLERFKLFDAKPDGGLDAVAAEGGAGAMFDRKYPEPAQLAADLKALTSRGVQLLLIYCGLDSTFAHPDQLMDLTGGEDLGERLKLVFMGGADHIFYRAEDRALAVGEICRWMQQTFPSVAQR